MRKLLVAELGGQSSPAEGAGDDVEINARIERPRRLVGED